MLNDYKKELKEIQKELIELEEETFSSNKINIKQLEELSNYCLEREQKFYQQWLLEIKKQNKRFFINQLKRPFYFIYRNRLNKKAKLFFT
ncbi:MAG: hypothetical protein KatS3mg129_1677 [Leptospiraceae bacterium]|nr:MAG: hypothetical protein KatS3mg129_1677 [Leptospiraceae bacterium]